MTLEEAAAASSWRRVKSFSFLSISVVTLAVAPAVTSIRHMAASSTSLRLPRRAAATPVGAPATPCSAIATPLQRRRARFGSRIDGGEGAANPIDGHAVDIGIEPAHAPAAVSDPNVADE